MTNKTMKKKSSESKICRFLLINLRLIIHFALAIRIHHIEDLAHMTEKQQDMMGPTTDQYMNFKIIMIIIKIIRPFSQIW